MLENTLYKLTVNKKLRIAYFGGSITEGTGSSDFEKTSYRAILTSYFRKKYPEADITEINAAIGGTGTSYGMYRVLPDVLAHKPDLVFVEFAVNDYGDTYDNIRCQTETIIRKLLLDDSTTDIIVLFSTSAEIIEAVERGEEYTSRSAQLDAAHRYRVLTVDHGAALHAAICKSGRPVSDYIPDTLHPSDIGHRALAECTMAILDKNLVGEIPMSVTEHSIPTPLSPKVFDAARLVPVTAVDTLKMCGFELKSAPDGERFPECLAAFRPGDSFSFEFDGDTLGFAWVGGYLSCDLLVSIDGGEAVTVRSWDHALRSFHRLQNAVFAKGLKLGHHCATVTATGDTNGEDVGEICGISGLFLC